MLWRRADPDRAGGIEVLAGEVAEEAAATKVVRDAAINRERRRLWCASAPSTRHKSWTRF
jgi:hypothetical protein